MTRAQYMAKVYDNCGSGVYYHCSAIDKGFTRDEWGKFCEDTRHTDAIVATYFGFDWNVHDVCRNPHTTEIYRDNRSFIEIMTAQRKDGLWTVGNSYQCLSGHQDDYGGGCGCWYDGETYQTEENAILAGLEWFKSRKNNTPKIQNAINKAIFDRRCKQLTLF